jgi:hypothetical protein
MSFGLDCDFDTSPIIDCLRRSTLNWNGASGPVAFVMRYLRNVATGGLTGDEVFAISSNGMEIVSISEHASNSRAYFTRAQGIEDANLAYGHGIELGQPANTPIYFAVDYDASAAADIAAVTDYFGGVRDTLAAQERSYRVGAYAGSCVLDALQAAGLCEWYWQISISPGYCGGANAAEWQGAHVRQVRANYALCGRSFDLDVAPDDNPGSWALDVVASSVG